MRKILATGAAILASASIVVASIMPALADSATNDTTGAGSTNSTTVTNSNSVNVTNVSDASITNTVTSSSNTGNNSASRNTMGGMVQSGDATTDVTILNNANINTTLLRLGGGTGNNTAGSSITGADSKNYATIANANAVSVRNDNTAVLQNTVNASSNTGLNLADENTDGGGGVVQSGDALTLVSLSNRANDSATAISGLANFGTNVVGNSITGHNSTNTASITNSNAVDVRNVSDAAVRNAVTAAANSGNNSASRNTMGGMVQSGDAGVDLELLTDANINTTSVDPGSGGSEATSGNSVTGADSTNFTSLLNSNSFSVLNENNKCTSKDCKDYEGVKWGVQNIDNDSTNTGLNLANENTFPGTVASGIATVGKYIRVCLNDTLTSIGALLP